MYSSEAKLREHIFRSEFLLRNSVYFYPKHLLTVSANHPVCAGTIHKHSKAHNFSPFCHPNVIEHPALDHFMHF